MSSHFEFLSYILGKTLAFGLPVLDFILRNWREYSNRVSPVALIIAPTRELAMQISTGAYVRKHVRRLYVHFVFKYHGPFLKFLQC